MGPSQLSTSGKGKGNQVGGSQEVENACGDYDDCNTYILDKSLKSNVHNG